MISSNGPLSASYIENIGAQPFLLCPSYLLPVDDLSVAGFALCAVREMFVLYKCLESQMSLLLRWVCFLPSAQPGARNVPSWWMLAWMQELCGRGYLDGRLIYLPQQPRKEYGTQRALTEKPVCRSRSDSESPVWNNWLVQDRERSTTGLSAVRLSV